MSGLSSRALGSLLILAGGLVVSGGGMMAALLVISAYIQQPSAERVGTALTQSVAIGALGGVLGLILVAEGIRYWRGSQATPFRLRRSGWLWLAFGLLLTVGTVLSVLAVPPVVMAPIHALTLLLLPALVLTAVGWGLSGREGSWADVAGGLVSGALLGTGAALAIESVLIVLVVIAMLALGWVPQEWLQETSQALTRGQFSFPTEAEALLGFLTPPVILVILALFSGMVPIVEEITKTLGVGIAGAWVRFSPPRAFLLGVASGAGFALVENALNSFFLGPVWGPGVLARLAATVMHSATGGLMGWGWGQWWSGRHPWRLPMAFVGAVTLHSIWNFVAVGMALIGLLVMDRAEQPLWMAVGGLIALLLLGIQFLITGGVTAGILWASHRLGRMASA
ncbi:MAG: PrsW family glutamic-type intramembrane protease [Anaerolineae bacterium]|nr:PrsW family glutamic-type intramembrane protease [Anaerolineae bacterium]MDW8067609.1 PrsW family glutamic-type intramembrane protease [Anaerolineae bacterium]